MKPYFPLLFVAVLLVSCSGTADNKVPELADEMCGCFDKFDQSLSPEAKTLMKNVSTAADPQSTMMTGISKLKKEDAMLLAEKLQSMAVKGSDISTCMENFDKKHSKETTKDKQALMMKLLEAMRAKGNCPVGGAIVSLGLKQGIK
jgi:hypothetical protein